MKGKYDDMLHLPHHVSVNHRPMSRAERAGQFSSFAALVGHEAAIRETGRLTQKKIELDESRKAALNRQLQLLLFGPEPKPTVTITWFEPDPRKQGGRYVETNGVVRRADPYGGSLEMADGTQIPVGQIYEISSEEDGFSDL